MAIATDTDMIGKMVQNNSMRFSLTDLHTHILPAVDDGAATVDMAAEMLYAQKKLGVDRVALTPHYYPLREAVDTFLERRQKSYSALCAVWEQGRMPQLSLGAEVRYTPKLAELELNQLTLGQSNYLLLELPDNGSIPLLEQVVDSMLCRDITPIFAHIERCEMFRKEPEMLLYLIRMGALAQISANALIGKGDSFAAACLRNGLAHIVASDTHKPGDCVDFLFSKKYNDAIQWTEHFARSVWDKTPLPAFSITPVKKGLFNYR